MRGPDKCFCAVAELFGSGESSSASSDEPDEEEEGEEGAWEPCSAPEGEQERGDSDSGLSSLEASSPVEVRQRHG